MRFHYFTALLRLLDATGMRQLFLAPIDSYAAGANCYGKQCGLITHTPQIYLLFEGG